MSELVEAGAVRRPRPVAVTPRDAGPVTGAPSDAEVEAAFCRGDVDGLEAAYRRWAPTVLAVARRAVGDAAAAEDVAQQVFVDAWRSRAGFDPDRRPLPAWLLGITRHVVADHHAARARQRGLAERLVGADPSLEATTAFADRVVDAAVVERGLARLGSPRRELVELAYLGQLSHREIAARTGLALGTVKSHLRRALRQLRADLEGGEHR